MKVKKKIEKLTLNKKTIVHLNNKSMTDAKGGASEFTYCGGGIDETIEDCALAETNDYSVCLCNYPCG